MEAHPPSSPFLALPPSEWVASNELAFAIRDRYPVSPGHTLVIPRRLVATWFEATPEEQRAIFDLVEEVRHQLDAAHPRPDGFNIGVNVGAAAGQTVMHLHVHVIPRYSGDVEDPTGGVRHVVPGRGNYLAERAPPLATGGTDDPFLLHLAPLWARATEVAIVAAFVQEGGLDAIGVPLFDALADPARSVRVRLVTGDYLAITQSAALERLLDWSAQTDGRLEARVVETATLPTRSRAFHPKCWRFEGPGLGVAFVGSSNLSHSALHDGVEWNLRLERGRDPLAWQRLVDGFEAWWGRARRLDADWVAAYARRASAARLPLPPGEEEAEAPPPVPAPNPIQLEALAALARARTEERPRCLVVIPTGVGKTLLAALDVAAVAASTGTLPRVLFVAHREEILQQAGATFRRVLREEWPGLRVSWFLGSQDRLDGDLVLASVQKLSLRRHLARLAPDAFDYVVVDEVHHALAPSYLRVLGHLRPRFLLGLTATPERGDGASAASLFDDQVRYRADLGDCIHRRLLVPFAYFGLKDDVDYQNIPWRNGRFDPAQLAAKVQTRRRMERLWQGWQEHPGLRTLVFCCSIAHAAFARDWLAARGVRVEAVHSAGDSFDREEALDALRDGRLDAVCAVDLFNEGVDLPEVDRVVMLRPTESPVVFLQQLGRGLRRAEAKERLTVVDFVGNHRVFLDRLRTLLSLGGGQARLRGWLEGDEADLPPSCSLDVELEAKDLLARLLPTGRGEVERVYLELLATRDARPKAGELYRMGYRPGTLRQAHGSWFEFVAAAGGMSDAERRVLAGAGEWLRDLESTAMTKSFKMVTLLALLEEDALATGLPVDRLARLSHEILLRSPELLSDVEGVAALPDPRHPDPGSWLRYWMVNPVAAWTRRDPKRATPWFRVDGDRFVPQLPVPAGDGDAFAAMTRELVDYRLAQYRARWREDTAQVGGGFQAKVLSNRRDPILKLPSADRRPRGEVTVRLPDGAVWQFRFQKEFCNVARPAGAMRNQLPDLLRRWFGPAAGRPGTAFFVRFSRSPDAWWVEPVGAEVVPMPVRGRLVAFPDLRAAAGEPGPGRLHPPEAEEVLLPSDATGDGLFAVRATGDSMDGGQSPIRDGDWLVMRYARGAGLPEVAGRVALVQSEDEHGAFAFLVKRVTREADRWLLRSDNPLRPALPASEHTTVVALLAATVRPERLAPPPGALVPDADLAVAFGLGEPPRPGRREEGHLFLFVETPGAFKAPDRLDWPVPDRRPAETAFVLVRGAPTDPWRYLGVARWLEAETLWATPELDFHAWRALGSGRSASRRLPDGALEQAGELVDHLLARVQPGETVHSGGRSFRLLGRAPEGGLRLDGGPGGFRERTVSLTDLAWVLTARARLPGGAVLDETWVNRLRYLDGTPKGSTRWVDTGWAIALAGIMPPGRPA